MVLSVYRYTDVRRHRLKRCSLSDNVEMMVERVGKSVN
jgi:hypothetical protein